MKLVNLTPHAVVIEPAGGSRVVLPPTGDLALFEAALRPGAPVGGIPVVLSGPGQLTGLPAQRPGVVLIVSRVVAQEAAGQGRADVYAPDTTRMSAIRDYCGAVHRVRRLVSFVAPSPD